MPTLIGREFANVTFERAMLASMALADRMPDGTPLYNLQFQPSGDNVLDQLQDVGPVTLSDLPNLGYSMPDAPQWRTFGRSELPPNPAMLASGEHFLSDLGAWLQEVTGSNVSHLLRPIPQRHALLRDMPVMAVRKKGQKGKDKSTRGYVWAETDPLQCLMNRWLTYSCHTLYTDVCDGDYRLGNLNWVYCPYYVSLFAGPRDPRTSWVKAVGKGRGDSYFPWPAGPEELKMRPYQAGGNAFLMLNEDDRPYLYLVSRNGHNGNSLYESCPEFPWDATVLRYAQTLCKRMGIGLAVDGGWCSYAQRNVCKDESSDGYGYTEFGRINTDRLESFNLRTPRYKVLKQGYNLPYYGDGACEMATCGYYSHTVTGYGYELVKPRLETLDGLTYPRTNHRSSQYVDPDRREPTCCYECDCNVDEDDVCQYNGYTYCEDCFHERFAHCDGCGDTLRRDYAQESPSGDTLCDDCFSVDYFSCSRCDEATCNSEAQVISGETVCGGCAEEAHTCHHCDGRTFQPEGYALPEPDAEDEVPFCSPGCLRTVQPEYESYWERSARVRREEQEARMALLATCRAAGQFTATLNHTGVRWVDLNGPEPEAGEPINGVSQRPEVSGYELPFEPELTDGQLLVFQIPGTDLYTVTLAYRCNDSYISHYVRGENGYWRIGDLKLFPYFPGYRVWIGDDSVYPIGSLAEVLTLLGRPEYHACSSITCYDSSGAFKVDLWAFTSARTVDRDTLRRNLPGRALVANLSAAVPDAATLANAVRVATEHRTGNATP